MLGPQPTPDHLRCMGPRGSSTTLSSGLWPPERAHNHWSRSPEAMLPKITVLPRLQILLIEFNGLVGHCSYLIRRIKGISTLRFSFDLLFSSACKLISGSSVVHLSTAGAFRIFQQNILSDVQTCRTPSGSRILDSRDASPTSRVIDVVDVRTVVGIQEIEGIGLVVGMASKDPHGTERIWSSPYAILSAMFFHRNDCGGTWSSSQATQPHSRSESHRPLHPHRRSTLRQDVGRIVRLHRQTCGHHWNEDVG